MKRSQNIPFWLGENGIIIIRPGGLLLVVVPSPICCSSFGFIGGVERKYITELGCEKYFCKVTYSAPLEML
jgi:hypothetical protein